MILLVDFFGREGRWLLSSLREAGLSPTPVSIGYDGHLPEGVYSPYEPEMGERSGAPLFFNELPVPENWEIRGSATQAEIYDYEQLRGRIYYSYPKLYRNIRIVDWLDPRGVVRRSDHYDRYGAHFATTILSREQKPVLRTYFDLKGREYVVENYQTGTVILTQEGKSRFFKSPSEFAAYQIKRREGMGETILYNSLHTSFFTARRLQKEAACRTVLFWQEPFQGEIPGNLQKVLSDPQGGTVIVQSAQAYEHLLRMGTDMSRFRRLGYIYPFEGENEGRPEALIFTNTDQVECLNQLTQALPQVTFHVCALTEMSSVLLSLGQRKNVRLYPCVTVSRAAELLKGSDFYLDINHGKEILEGTERAFLNQLVILAFRETLHDQRFVAPLNVFSSQDYPLMVRRIQEGISSKEACRTLLEIQKGYALCATPQEYRSILWEEGIID